MIFTHKLRDNDENGNAYLIDGARVAGYLWQHNIKPEGVAIAWCLPGITINLHMYCKIDFNGIQCFVTKTGAI